MTTYTHVAKQAAVDTCIDRSITARDTFSSSSITGLQWCFIISIITRVRCSKAGKGGRELQSNILPFLLWIGPFPTIGSRVMLWKAHVGLWLSICLNIAAVAQTCYSFRQNDIRMFVLLVTVTPSSRQGLRSPPFCSPLLFLLCVVRGNCWEVHPDPLNEIAVRSSTEVGL